MSTLDEHFRGFAKLLEEQIGKYEYDTDEDRLKRQKRQVERLIGLEKKFRLTLVKHPWGDSVYEAFVSFITDPKEKGGKNHALASRPYFRERQNVCIGPICQAIKKRDVKKLQKFHVNSTFVLFAMSQKQWAPGSEVRRLAKEIKKQRDELVVSNMPLAISQARLFWGKAASKDPNQALSYMDLVQLGSEGLISAIDKYRLPFSATFRATMVQWCVGNFIEAFSQTMFHFYPKDKKKIYHANKQARYLTSDEYLDERERNQRLADKINSNVKASHHTNAEEIGHLMAAASVVSADTPAPGEDGPSRAVSGSYIDRAYSDPEKQPDNHVQGYEVHSRLQEAIALLRPYERKILKLRGVAC